ncbi:hypothetical protein SDC9_78216 [bioreactor metagenome]|uniref:Uncharacterized protein n=1 Tax=bioreactor metagenome TaxID=1076179 RepID=A0A644YTL3_9ZZZZ
MPIGVTTPIGIRARWRTAWSMYGSDGLRGLVDVSADVRIAWRTDRLADGSVGVGGHGGVVRFDLCGAVLGQAGEAGPVLARDPLQGGGVGSGLVDEDGLAVVAQLLDGLLDVGECAVVPVLGRGVVVGLRVPPPRQLLDRGDVDVAVVDVRLQLGHVLGQEGAVGADRVAGQGRLARLLDVLADVGQHLLLGLGHRQAPVELGQQAGGGVHLPDEVPHVCQGGGGGLDHHVDPVTEDVELPVRDERGHLDQLVMGQVEARHLAVDPHQFVRHASILIRCVRGAGRRAVGGPDGAHPMARRSRTWVIRSGESRRSPPSIRRVAVVRASDSTRSMVR